jgi:hypothetical protein
MSDDRGSSWVGPFLLGFLLGVLICVGAGGTLLVTAQQSQMMAAREARMAEAMARQEADEARMRAEEARAHLEKELKAAKERKK